MLAWGSDVAVAAGLGRGGAVGVALAAGRFAMDEAFEAGNAAAAAFFGSGALEAIGIGSPASIASIIEISLD